MAHFEIYEDRRGQYRWRLRADNNKVIADSSEGYQRKSACERGIALMTQQAPGAQVEDRTQWQEDQT